MRINSGNKIKGASSSLCIAGTLLNVTRFSFLCVPIRSDGASLLCGVYDGR